MMFSASLAGILSLLMRLLAFLAFVLFLPSYADATSKIKVLVSLAPLALVVEDVAGEWVDVEVLLQGGASPHHYALKISERKALNEADLAVWIGQDFERFLAQPMAVRAGPVVSFASLVSLVSPIGSHGHEGSGEHAHGMDLHLWLNPQHVALLATAVVSSLKKILPSDSHEKLNERLERYKIQLLSAQKEILAELAPLKAAQFAAYHSAYGRFAQAFGLQQAASVTLMSEQGVSARKLVRLRRQLKSSACLLADVGEQAAAQRYAVVLDLPLVVTDLLVSGALVESYPQYIRALSSVMASCLGMKKGIG